MPGSNRNVIVALGLIVLVSWSLFLGWYLAQPLNAEKERYQSYRYAADKPLEIDPAGTGQPDTKSLQYRAPCDQPKGQSESDLCAQWRAANAAEDSAFWAQWGFWIAVIGSSLLLWQIILTRKAVEDTSEATDAMREANRIAFDAQRPWVSISCNVERFVKGDKSVEFQASLEFLNTGNVAARCFLNKSSPQLVQGQNIKDIRERLWREWRKSRSPSHRVLLPGEAYPDGIAMWARTDFPDDGSREEQPFHIIVVAAAHYKITDEEWHTTERSFLIGIRTGERDIINSQVELFKSDTPIMDYPLDMITVRQIESGETS